MFDRASKKLGLEQAVLGTFGQDDDDDKPSGKEMEQLLKRGAYALLEDDNDEVVKQFCADDIDSILAKRTRTRVVEGAKTASWLNKQGMVVSKSRFTSDNASAQLDMDDPMFWQKVMPDFITPQIMIQQLQDLTDEIFGITRKRGRGRGRWKRKPEEEKNENTTEEIGTEVPADVKKSADPVVEPSSNGDDIEKGQEVVPADEKEESGNEVDAPTEEGGSNESEEEEEEEKPFQLTKTQKRRIAKFQADLKSMMENLLDEEEDDTLSPDQKAAAQNLLLTISVKKKIFNEDQRAFARKMLKRLEGNRRRRCRTTDQTSEKAIPGGRGRGNDEIREELRIVSKKIKKRRRRRDGELEDDDEPKKKRRKHGGIDPESGYKYDSDDPAEWSDIGDEEDMYSKRTKKKALISRKEAQRRRQWAADDDAATAAGRSWPAIPRSDVPKVLGSMLESVIAHDLANGGIFSVPVPRDEFPEYYEQISKPMDYGTMKKKLENGEYRSAQAMQKDFILIMQNCLKFNAPDSEIVSEIRQQALMRPNLLRAAATKHDLFLAEDGSVLKIVDEKGFNGSRKRRGKRRREEDVDAKGKQKKSKKKTKTPVKLELGVGDDDVPLASLKRKELVVEEAIPQAEAESDPIEQENNEDPGDDTAGVNGRNKRSRRTPAALQSKETPRRRGNTRAAKTSSEEPLPVPMASARSRRREAAGNGIVLKNDADFLNTSFFKSEREALKDKSFAAVRELFTKRGPWQFPESLNSDKFAEVALATIKKLDKVDRYSVFADVVTDDDAPDYSKIVKNPIATCTMKTKLEKGEYGEGSEGAVKLYNDILLMFDNCRLYNDDDEGDVIEEAIRIFALVPELYSEACAFAFKKQKRS